MKLKLSTRYITVKLFPTLSAILLTASGLFSHANQADEPRTQEQKGGGQRYGIQRSEIIQTETIIIGIHIPSNFGYEIISIGLYP